MPTWQTIRQLCYHTTLKPEQFSICENMGTGILTTHQTYTPCMFPTNKDQNASQLANLEERTNKTDLISLIFIEEQAEVTDIIPVMTEDMTETEVI